jgi:DNA polymerase-3 subunit delta'
MPFAELTAQDRATAPLRAALARGTLHHAYLFGGPPGAGKAAAARLLAQAANCEGGAAGPGGFREDPCGACGPCRKIARGLHPDVFVLHDERTMVKQNRWEARSGRSPSQFILVEQVRDVVDHRLALKRFEGRRRFVVIDPADAMNPQAQNALLKTLEEPPEDTTLVLVSASPDALLPTIRSRCLRVAFAPRPREAAPAEVRALVARAAALDPDDPLAWLAFAKEAAEGREQVDVLGQALLAWLRDVLAVQAGAGEGALALPDLAAASRGAAAALSPAEVIRRREEVEATVEAVRQNAGAVLALERLLVAWFHGGARGRAQG